MPLSSGFTASELARDAWADINTVKANLGALSADDLKEAKDDLLKLARRANFWARVALTQDVERGLSDAKGA